MEASFEALQGKQEETLQDLRKKLSQGADENNSSYLSYIKATNVEQFSDVIAATWADEYMQSNPLPPPPLCISKNTTVVIIPKTIMIDEEEESIVLSTEMTVGGLCGSPTPLLVDNFIDQDDALESYIPSGLNTGPGIENVRESLLADLADEYEQSCLEHVASSSSNVNKETVIETVGDDSDDDVDDYEHNDQNVGEYDHEEDGFTAHLDEMPSRAKEVFLSLGTEKEKQIREEVGIDSNVEDSFIVSPFVSIVD